MDVDVPQPSGKEGIDLASDQPPTKIAESTHKTAEGFLAKLCREKVSRQPDRQAGRQTGRQAGRQTGRRASEERVAKEEATGTADAWLIMTCRWTSNCSLVMMNSFICCSLLASILIICLSSPLRSRFFSGRHVHADRSPAGSADLRLLER
jgi:hypothetical protein